MEKQKCECCGNYPAAGCVVYGEVDAAGRLWTHYTCEQCHEHCSSDENGNPVHMRPDWDGTPETFETCRA